jgi:hypothetical protein
MVCVPASVRKLNDVDSATADCVLDRDCWSLTRRQYGYNQALGFVRAGNEHANAFLKRFRILNGSFRGRIFNESDFGWNVIKSAAFFCANSSAMHHQVFLSTRRDLSIFEDAPILDHVDIAEHARQFHADFVGLQQEIQRAGNNRRRVRPQVQVLCDPFLLHLAMASHVTAVQGMGPNWAQNDTTLIGNVFSELKRDGFVSSVLRLVGDVLTVIKL